LACRTCTWDKLPYQNLKPRRTAICLRILIYYTLPFAVMAEVTTKIWTQVWSFICLLGASLIVWLLLSFVLLWDTGGSEPSDGCLEAVSRLLCTESSASYACYLLIFLELWEGHGVTTHLLTALCVGPSSNIPSDTANIFSNQEQALLSRLYKRFTALGFATALQSVYTLCETGPQQKRHLGSNKLACNKLKIQFLKVSLQ
jgi:hypothetical protein